MYKFIDLDTGLPAALNKIKTWVNTKLATKQDSISDLATIRSGAAAGASAYQKPVTGIPMNDLSQDVQDAIDNAGGGSVESVTVSGTKHLPDANGDVDLGNLRGQDGNSGVASADGVESVNNLNGGTTDTSSRVYVLGANQGKRLRDQIEYVYARLQTVYAALGNIAFWDGKTPIANILPDLDWGAAKHTITLSLSLTDAVVKHNGVAKSNGDTIVVEEGGTLTLIVEPALGYALTSVTSSTTGATVTDNGNGTFSVSFVMGGSDATLSVTATAESRSYAVTYNLTNCTAAGPATIPPVSPVTIVLTPSSNYALPLAVIVTGATLSSYNNQTGEIVVSNATGAVTIQADAICMDFIFENNTVIGDYSANYYYLGYGSGNNANKRVAIVVPREGLVNPCTWGTPYPNADVSLEQTTSTIPVPYAAEKVKIKMTNSSYNISVGLLNSLGVNQKSNAWDRASSTAQEFNLASYPNCTHIGINIRKSNNTAFTLNSLADIGFDLTFE